MCKISVGGEEMTSNLHNWTGEFVAEKERSRQFHLSCIWAGLWHREGLGAVCLLALILHSTTRWLCSYSKGFLEPTMSGSEAASGRQALAGAVCGARGANDDAIHPGLEIVLFSFPWKVSSFVTRRLYWVNPQDTNAIQKHIWKQVSCTQLF